MISLPQRGRQVPEVHLNRSESTGPAGCFTRSCGRCSCYAVARDLGWEPGFDREPLRWLLSRKESKSRRHGRKLRSAGTKARTGVGRARTSASALERELAEAREQQAATSDVLRLISTSTGGLEPVFQAMLEKATRICQAKFGILWLCEVGGFRSVALHGLPPAHAERRRLEPIIYPEPEVPLGRV